MSDIEFICTIIRSYGKDPYDYEKLVHKALVFINETDRDFVKAYIEGKLQC